MPSRGNKPALCTHTCGPPCRTEHGANHTGPVPHCALECVATPYEAARRSAIRHAPFTVLPPPPFDCGRRTSRASWWWCGSTRSTFRPTEVELLIGDPAKAKEKLGWVPKIPMQELCKEMVASDIARVEKGHLTS